MEYRGIDVSDNQGLIDWKKVKEAGCKFAILRSVRGSGKDDYQFLNNLAGCRQQSIPVAVYKYTYATNTTDARKEANQVIDLLKRTNLKCKVFWDVEDNSLYYLQPSVLTSVIHEAQKVIEDAGYQFCLYTGYHVYNEKWFDYSGFTCPLWIARYPYSSDKNLFDLMPDSKKPIVGRALYGWQFSSKGRVDGIGTYVDLDILYDDPTSLSLGQADDTKAKVYIGTKIVKAYLEEKEGVNGYTVIYPDGYKSWCQRDIFEKSYKELDCIDFING